MTSKNTNLKNKNLLILTHAFPDKNNIYPRCSFIKAQINSLKIYFKNIYVIAPIPHIDLFKDYAGISSDYTYDNVHVYYPRYTILPQRQPFTNIKYKLVLNCIINTINTHNLDIDLIHAHYTHLGGIAASQIKQRYNIPYLITIHENSNWFDEELLSHNEYLQMAWKDADALIRVNPFDLSRLKKYNKSCHYVANGYSPSFKRLNRDSCRKTLGVPIDCKILLGVGFLIKRKGFNYLIDAMSMLVPSHQKLECYIVGDGEEYDHLMKQIKQLNLEGKVHLLGTVSGTDLPFWMNAADIFILPSLAESFGVVQIEALSCGKPVVAAENDGSRLVICSREYGILCKPESAPDLANTISHALNTSWNEDLILQYAKKYTWDEIAKQLVEIYYRVFNK